MVRDAMVIVDMVLLLKHYICMISHFTCGDECYTSYARRVEKKKFRQYKIQLLAFIEDLFIHDFTLPTWCTADADAGAGAAVAVAWTTMFVPPSLLVV